MEYVAYWVLVISKWVLVISGGYRRGWGIGGGGVQDMIVHRVLRSFMIMHDL